jgi:hypothetical protein
MIKWVIAQTAKHWNGQYTFEMALVLKLDELVSSLNQGYSWLKAREAVSRLRNPTTEEM